MSDTAVRVALDSGGSLDGELLVPSDPRGLVVFAHGSGSSRASPRNRFVAECLQRAGVATLLIDLLTADEETTDRDSGRFRFDIELLARRLGHIIDWTDDQGRVAVLPLGLFGASTGAAAALVAAAHRPDRVGAVVSRGGRPDLARADLALVVAPTMLIVGSRDPQVLELNRAAANALSGECQLEIVEGATHLFEESGTLDRVAELAVEWFTSHFAVARTAS